MKKGDQNPSIHTITPTASLQKKCNENSFVSPKASEHEKNQILAVSDDLIGIITQIIDLIEQKGQKYTLYSLLDQSLFPMFLLSGIKTELDKAYENEKVLHLSEFGKKIAKWKNKVIEKIETYKDIIKVDGSYDYLASMSVFSQTSEKMEELSEQIKKKEIELKEISDKEIVDTWKEEIAKI